MISLARIAVLNFESDLSQSNVLTQISKCHYDSLEELYKVIGEPERVKATRGKKTADERDTLHLVSSADLLNLPRTGKVLVVDFGCAFFIDYPPTAGVGIPIAYAAPEILYEKVDAEAASPAVDLRATGRRLFEWCRGRQVFTGYNREVTSAASPAVDLWAIGCLLFEWCCGQKLFTGYARETISAEWTVLLGKLPEPFWEEFSGRKKLFDDHGKLRRNQSLPYVLEEVTDISHWLNKCWGKPSGYSKEMSRFNTQSMPWYPDHWPAPPRIPISVSRDMTKERSVVTRITPGLSYKTTTTNLNDESNHLKPDDENLQVEIENSPLDVGVSTRSQPKNIIDTPLSRCAPTKAPIQLPPGAADFHCLLKQLLVYDPDQRLPALMVLRHHWFLDNPKPCEAKEITATQGATDPTSATSKEDGPEPTGLEARIPTRWSLAFDEGSQRWEYFRKLEEPM
ncbi:hypothetical protein ONS96_005226 [Cadophora gregata f. sp. sojae]|nr:hypothetical protein ONS96_005226 [Cadophora gregata f. sp. sojae]